MLTPKTKIQGTVPAEATVTLALTIPVQRIRAVNRVENKRRPRLLATVELRTQVVHQMPHLILTQVVRLPGHAR